MNRKQLAFIAPLLIAIVATVAVFVMDLDLRGSALFNINGKWPVGELNPWLALRLYGYYPSYVLGFLALILFGAGFSRQSLRPFRLPSLYLVILLLLGPGLLVNTVFKDHWGRPRPREIRQFGGNNRFHHPWQPGTPGEGRSFPSGHAAAAFYLAMPAFVLRRRFPVMAPRIYIAGTLYGMLMGIARIAQGGHFVSDIIWAWCMVHLTAVALYYLMGLHRDEADASSSRA